MTLAIQDLHSLMAPLTDLGRGEATFEVGGLSVTLRTLTPEEEIATQRYARGALTEGDSNDQINALDYLDRFRVYCLGNSIVQIGDVDFRGVTTIETGEKLQNGVAVKIKKHEALIKVTESWSRSMVTTLFQRFTSLMEKVESGIEKTLKYDDDHIDAEISRLEEKLADLKTTKSKRDVAKSDPRDGIRNAASDKPTPKESPAAPEPEAPKETWETARLNRTSTEETGFLEEPADIPRSLSTDNGEVAPAAKAEAPAATVRKPVFGDRPKPREVPEAEKSDPLGGVQSSLVDTDDPDVIEAENRRLMSERMKRMSPVPPHLAAREVAQSIEQAGSIEGVPVFRMPSQDLNPDTAAKPARVPPAVAKSNLNPNFRPAK